MLDCMVSIAESASRGVTVTVESNFDKAPAVPKGWDPEVATSDRDERDLFSAAPQRFHRERLHR